MSGEITLYGMYESVDMAAREIVDDNPGLPVEDLGYQITEQADSLVSVYYAECAREWILAGMPDAADYYGGEYGEDDNIHKRISMSMYFWYEWQLRESVEKLLEETNNDNGGDN